MSRAFWIIDQWKSAFLAVDSHLIRGCGISTVHFQSLGSDHMKLNFTTPDYYLFFGRTMDPTNVPLECRMVTLHVDILAFVANHLLDGWDVPFIGTHITSWGDVAVILQACDVPVWEGWCVCYWGCRGSLQKRPPTSPLVSRSFHWGINININIIVIQLIIISVLVTSWLIFCFKIVHGYRVYCMERGEGYTTDSSKFNIWWM